MRLALILPGFSRNADDWAIPALQNLAVALAKRYEVHVFSQRYPEAGRYQLDGVTHHALGGGQRFGVASLRLWLATAQAIAAQHLRTPFDLLHAFWADEAGFAAVMAAEQRHLPVVVSLGGGELTYLPHIGYGGQRFLARRLTTRYALKRATLVTAGSPYQSDLCLRHGVPDAKLRLAPLGVDTTHFHPAEAAPPPHTITQAASLLPVKNQAMLLETLALVQRDLPNIRLHLAGTGPLQAQLVQQATDLGVSHAIAWHRRVPYAELPAFYQQSRLYVQSSMHESQGMAVLEAMACGLPVVGTPVGVVRDVAHQPPTFDPATLAAQIIETLRQPPEPSEVRRFVDARFGMAAALYNFEEIYREALQQ